MLVSDQDQRKEIYYGTSSSKFFFTLELNQGKEIYYGSQELTNSSNIKERKFIMLAKKFIKWCFAITNVYL